MRVLTLLLAGAAGIAFAAPASAQSSTSVGITGGTLGIGPEVGFRGANFGVRANATFFNFERSVESDGVDYDGDLKLRSYGAMADLYPFGGGFRISAGARMSRNRIELEAVPTEDVEIGDNVYTPEEVGEISGTVKAKKFAPMATIGWTSGGTSGFFFGIDAGAMFQGSPRVRDLQTTGMLSDPDLQDDLERERLEIEDDIDRYKVYPVLQLSAGLRFGGSDAAAAYEPAVVAPPPAPAAPATQTCPDGSVILATDICPAPPPPPPPPTPPGERG